MYFNLLEKFVILTFYPLVGIFSYAKAVIGKELSIFVFLPVFIYVFINLLYSLYNLAIVKSINRSVASVFHIKKLWLLILFVIFILNGLFFSGITGAKEIFVSYGMLIVFGAISLFCFFITYRNSKKLNATTKLVDYISISIFLYISINVLGAIIGVENPLFWEQYSREFESLTGLTEYRVQYPFTSSGQYFSIESGISSIFGLVWWFNKSNFNAKFFGIVMILVGITAMFGHAARAPIVLYFLIFGVILLWKYGSRSIIKPLIVVQIIIVPLIAYDVIGELLEYLFSIFSGSFSRVEGDIGSLSGRNVIWKIGLEHMLYDASLFNSLFGYGAFGQISSGVNIEYAYLFSQSYAEPEKAALHNSLLQYWIDFGFLGLMTLVLLLYTVTTSYLRALSSNKFSLSIQLSKLGVSIITYIFLCGITETIISYYSIGIFTILVIFSLLAFVRVVDSDVKLTNYK